MHQALLCLPCGSPAPASPPAPPARRVAPPMVDHPTAAATRGTTAPMPALGNAGNTGQGNSRQLSWRPLQSWYRASGASSLRLVLVVQGPVGRVQPEAGLVPSSGTSRLLCGRVLAAGITALRLSRGPVGTSEGKAGAVTSRQGLRGHTEHFLSSHLMCLYWQGSAEAPV